MADKYTEIINGSIKGEVDSQRKLYNLLSDKMFALCLRYTKDEDEAKDFMQDGFIKVFKNLKQFKFSGSFEGWVRRIIINTIIEHFRSKKMRFSAMNIVDYSDDFKLDSVVDELSAQDILKIVRALSPQYRTVFNLYAIEGYSHKEIAEKLGISEGTSKSNLSRARSILQKKLNQLMGEVAYDKKKLKIEHAKENERYRQVYQ